MYADRTIKTFTLAISLLAISCKPMNSVNEQNGVAKKRNLASIIPILKIKFMDQSWFTQEIPAVGIILNFSLHLLRSTPAPRLCF